MLTKEQKGEIVQFKNEGMGYGTIGKKFRIARSSIQRICKSYGKRKNKPGPRPIIDKNVKLAVKRYINHKYELKEKTTLRTIIKDLDLTASRNTVQRCIKVLQYDYRNIPSKFQLTTEMKLKRKSAARSYIEKMINWRTVIFTDEKKFSLVGCDSYQTWVKEGQSPRRISKVLKSPSLMVWGMVLPNGLFSYRIMRGKQNSEKFITMFHDYALPIIKLNLKDHFILQQDNCPIHVSKQSRNYFEKSKIELLPWPPYSPDLNIIENIWSILSTLVYKAGPAKNLKDLEEILFLAVVELNSDYRNQIMNLYSSMPRRICKILENGGQRLKY